MKKTLGLALVLSSLILAACDGGSSNPGDDDQSGTPDAAVNPGIDAGPDDWVPLISGSWTIPGGAAGEDVYKCVIYTVPEDMYIKAFKPIIPGGTHHTVLTTNPPGNQADGIYDCNAGTNGQSMIYGSGVGSPEFHFPDGVGLHLTKGERLLLNLHLFNGTQGELSGTSGTQVLVTTADKIQHEAEVVLAGPVAQLQVPTGQSTQSGTCNASMNILKVDNEVHIFATAGHMHMTGTHVKSTITNAGGSTVFQDRDYSFDSQDFEFKTPEVILKKGDTIKTECSYDNADAPKIFGDSSNDEMCFTDIFYYPAQHAQFICPF